ADKFRVPVLGIEELKAQYLFGARDLVRLLFYLSLTVLVYFLLFTFQEPLLTFIASGHTGRGLAYRIGAAVTIAVIVPIVAFIIGDFYKHLLKLVKLE
ncbi:MAG: hypothetical protein GXP54_10830, partial [Deltaproteobacteria bacterium]|nr:hypothetical protein [Deltaproteobacteria bacterium]